MRTKKFVTHNKADIRFSSMETVKDLKNLVFRKPVISAVKDLRNLIAHS